jgi:ribonucleoside-diphosphate reductase alpha chain
MAGIGNDFQITSLSNCFVIGNDIDSDSYGGIMKLDQELVQLMKRRAGVGLDLSFIRPSGTPVKNSALTSTGVVPYMERFSNSTREVAQDGRRGALMESISIIHPDAEKFIDAKMDESKVTGANISIRISDNFMKASLSNEEFTQQFPVESETPKTSVLTDANKLWKKIIHNAWKRAEPGILYWDTIIRESIPDCYADLGFKTVSTNPCGEITLCSNDSCRLLVLNLYSYVENPFSESATFNFELFKTHAKIAQRLMDDLIELELEKIDKIIEKIKNDPEDIAVKHAELNLWLNIKKKCIQGRRTGLGITGEGDMIAALGLTYGTDESNTFAENIARTLKLSAYESSVNMAQERGSFPLYDAKREENNPFLLRIKEESPELYERMIKYGRRNIALLTIAPTGSVSILTQTTSGVEPAFLISYMRRKKINPNDKNTRVDFKDSVGDCWQEYPVFHHKFLDYLKVKQYDIDEVMNMSKEEIAELIKKSPYHKATSNDVDWVKKVEMQGLLQKHVDHSISVTVNLPNDVTEEIVSKVYQTGWESGCKGITVYRDGSRSGVLVAETKKEDEFQYHNAPKRPKELPCDVFHITAKGKKWTIVVGLYDNKPYECFGIEHSATEVPETFRKGTLVKEGRGIYVLKNDKYSITDITSNMTDEEEALTRMISTALRHGSSIDFIVDQLGKSQGTVVSYNKAIARVLSKYAKVLDKNKGACDNCGSTNVSYEVSAKVRIHITNIYHNVETIN